MGGRLFSTPTNDQMIFGQEMVSMLSVTLIAVILHWTMTSFKKDYSLTASRSMKIPCLISIISFLIMNIVGMIGWNDVFIPISSTTCKVIYPFCLLSYNFGKIAMYQLFTFRIELIFKHTSYQISILSLTIYRILCCIIPTILWCIWIYLSWNDIKPHDTDSTDPQYQYCFPQHFKDSPNSTFFNLAENVMASIAVCDLIFSGIPLLLFIYKYYQVTSLYRRAKIIEPNINDNGDLYQGLLNANLPGFELKHIAIIRKSTMLVMIAIFSTWIFIIGSAYILRQLGFYLPFDGVINSLCIACLFQFGDDFYAVTFAKLECCCLCFGPFCNKCSICSCCGDVDSDNITRHNSQDPNNENNPLSFTTTSSDKDENGDNVKNKNAIQHQIKIHSIVKNNDNGNNGMNGYDGNQIHPQYPRSSNVIKINRKQKNKHGLGLLSFKNTPTTDLTGTFQSKLNISTPTQRYVGSPEQQLFVGGQSITEFIPLNLQQQRDDDNDNEPDITSTIQTGNGDVADNDNDNDDVITPQTPITDQKDILQFSHTADSALTDSTSNNMKPANKTGAIPVIKQYKKASKLSRF